MAARTGGSGEKRLLFEQVALPHLDALYTAALRLTRNPEDAKDLLQETVLRGYRSFHQFTPGTNCRAWLLTILYNNFRNICRKGTHEQTASNEVLEREIEAQRLSSDSAPQNPEDLLAGRMAGRRLAAALNSLPAEFREALLLVDVQELNYQEVADVLDVPLGTVKSRVSRGRALMRAALEKLATPRGKTGT